MRLLSLLLPLALLLVPVDARAVGLYGLLRDANGPLVDALLEIDPATGASQTVGALPDRIWNDLAGRPGDAGHVYAVSRLPGFEFENTFSRIDTATASVSDLHHFTAADLGFGDPFILELVGVSFAPGDASEAFVLGAFLDLSGSQPSQIGLFRLDLDTGDTSSLVTSPNFMLQLAHAPDGTLFTRNPATAEIATLDPASGVKTPIGNTPALSITSLAFHPFTGELFAAEGSGIEPDELVLLSSLDASLLEVRGTVVPDGSINALAFVVPEPGTGALVLAGLAALAARRRR